MSRRRSGERAKPVQRSRLAGGCIGTATLADMSVPAEARRKVKTTKTARTPVPAQMQHGNGRRARKLRDTYAAKLRKSGSRG